MYSRYPYVYYIRLCFPVTLMFSIYHYVFPLPLCFPYTLMYSCYPFLHILLCSAITFFFKYEYHFFHILLSYAQYLITGLFGKRLRSDCTVGSVIYDKDPCKFSKSLVTTRPIPYLHQTSSVLSALLSVTGTFNIAGIIYYT